MKFHEVSAQPPSHVKISLLATTTTPPFLKNTQKSILKKAELFWPAAYAAVAFLLVLLAENLFWNSILLCSV